MPVSKKRRVKAKPTAVTASLVPDLPAMDAYVAATPREQQLAALEKAQTLMYEAWEAQTDAGRKSRCQRALTVSPLCADAYNALAGMATSARLRLPLFELALAAGERALGPEGFEEYAGGFWGWLETRPYMRARHGVAMTLEELGRYDEAIVHYDAMLELNPGDNQGIRYLLLHTLLARGKTEAVQQLLDRFDDEVSVQFTMTRALVTFQERGDTEAARDFAKAGMKRNKHVLSILTRQLQRVERSMFGVTVGGPDEALDYVRNAGAGWFTTKGAIPWLAAIAAQTPEAD
jgi:tetratricopeptide (TPR) repeat protein